MASFDPVTTTAAQLVDLLSTKTVTSVHIINVYLAQIAAHNTSGRNLRALINVTPTDTLHSIARALDEERLAGKSRGPLHGIPFVVKDVIGTGPEFGVPTTAGTWALRDAMAKENSVVVQRLVDRGMIMLGKANMTELCGLKDPYATKPNGRPGLMPGWSAVFGQTQSAYMPNGLAEDELILGHTAPGGSSSGSAVCVAAGFSPLALGTECAGSVVTPAQRAGLYAMTMTNDRVPKDGCMALSLTFDKLGAMAKSAEDLELFMAAAMALEPGQRISPSEDTSDWSGISIGVADPTQFSLPDGICHKVEAADEQMCADYKRTVERVRELGAKVVYPVEMPSPSIKFQDRLCLHLIAKGEMRHLFPKFTAGLQNPRVKTFADLVQYNEEHAEQAMPEPYPGQRDIIAGRDDTTTEATLVEARAYIKAHAGVAETMAKHGVDLLLAPADSSLCTLAAAAEYPNAVLPIGVLECNGRPFGMGVVCRKGEEDKGLRFLRAYDAAFPGHVAPQGLSPALS